MYRSGAMGTPYLASCRPDTCEPVKLLAQVMSRALATTRTCSGARTGKDGRKHASGSQTSESIRHNIRDSHDPVTKERTRAKSTDASKTKKTICCYCGKLGHWLEAGNRQEQVNLGRKATQHKLVGRHRLKQLHSRVR